MYFNRLTKQVCSPTCFSYSTLLKKDCASYPNFIIIMGKGLEPFATGLYREYWTIYGGPGFLAVVWFASSPTPPPPPLSKLDKRHTARLRKRDNLLTGEGGWSRRPPESLVLYKTSNTLWISHKYAHAVLSTYVFKLFSNIVYSRKPLAA